MIERRRLFPSVMIGHRRIAEVNMGDNLSTQRAKLWKLIRSKSKKKLASIANKKIYHLLPNKIVWSLSPHFGIPPGYQVVSGYTKFCIALARIRIAQNNTVRARTIKFFIESR